MIHRPELDFDHPRVPAGHQYQRHTLYSCATQIPTRVTCSHTFVALVQDKPGVLTRVASLFRRLNINIVSLYVGESSAPTSPA